MIGWRRRAKAARENTVTPERLYELVSQTLMENFGPLGSFAITRRSSSDTDDIFHTSLARSVAHDIVANLAEHGVVLTTAGGAVASPGRAAAAPAAPSTAPAAAAAAAAAHRMPGRPQRAAGVFPFTAPLAPVEAVVVPRELARAVSGAVAERPAVAPEPLDDDALRSLVAHHAEVEAAVAAKGERALPPIAI
ncbi:hypothetical protein N1031_14955 [Herbiconiux moechotypicola]|uniref:Uncharacterized protein n=1 Tax=Herbiconiux moechotypicola TaxID=637393 RepID=A0ABN3DU67_9MICO|nr:hypothetical protein [Herbiconiux moechotypicola]MCS5731063.1 hypothetical protein [Herbiconiux moechotypicola]